jgi:myo-inositol-1(or 4)-monophosphatase
MMAVSLAFVEAGRPTLGIIDAPFLQTRFSGSEGHGATRNGQPIQCRNTAELRDAIVSVGDFATGPDAAHKNVARLQAAAALAVWTERVRMHGSAALDLAFVASGLTDGAMIFGGKEWDVAAGTIISREAGAIVFQAPNAPTIAANPALLGALRTTLSTATQGGAGAE